MRSLIILAACSSFQMVSALAASSHEQELERLKSQHEKAVSAAVEPLNRRYHDSLEQLLRRAMQKGDLEGAVRIRAELEKLGKSTGVSFGRHPRELQGEWLFIVPDWRGTRTLNADGTVARRDGSGARWWVDGDVLFVSYPNGLIEELQLPEKNGKLRGKNSRGFPMTAERVRK